jgi:hypothetical protein
VYAAAVLAITPGTLRRTGVSEPALGATISPRGPHGLAASRKRMEIGWAQTERTASNPPRIGRGTPNHRARWARGPRAPEKFAKSW